MPDEELEITSSQVKHEPVPEVSKPLPKMEINLPLDEDLIEVVDSPDEEKMQIDTRQIPEQKEQKSPVLDTSPIKRSNTSIYSSSVDDWVTRKKPKTLSDYFSASSRSGSLSSLQSLDASAEVKKSDHSSDAVLASTTSSLKSSSSFSSKDKFPIQLEDDDDFKTPSSRSISPVKQKSQSSGETKKSKSSQSNKPKKSDKATSSDQKSSAKKFKKQDSSHRPTRRLDPDDDGTDLDDFK